LNVVKLALGLVAALATAACSSRSATPAPSESTFSAVTDDAGRFDIGQLLPGGYTLEFWHERFGTPTQQVTVAAREIRDLSLSHKAS
jgi:ABC-type glycerol-3-phosphate transport system substrate-binding protein